MLTLEDIRIYPVKGLRGVPVLDAEVEPWGLAQDRRWMIVDPVGRFLTQREVPRMALVKAELRPEGLELSIDGTEPIRVSVPGKRAPEVVVTVWSDAVRVRAAHRSAADWLSEALGLSCGLVHMANPATARPVDPAFAEAGDRVSFADGFPLLATTTASLDDLNGRLASPVCMDRFRPNVVVAGSEPWAEDRWSRLRIGTVHFVGVKDCARCTVTTVDQRTGVEAATGEPLRTLGTFRRKARGRIIFGQNVIPRGVGRIRVGDRVEVAE